MELARKTMLKKILGIVLIILGIISALTPFTPFGWLFFLGLEMLGLRIVFQDKIKSWFQK